MCKLINRKKAADKVFLNIDKMESLLITSLITLRLSQ
jgi:hypothetical protein